MATTVPFKTPLGHEELRSRANKLGQRHRTILFLIDGKRALAEVLSLAQQAGAATHHFEDLLRLGLVELPPEPSPPAIPVSPEADAPKLTAVELDVPADADEPVTVRAPLEIPVLEDLPLEVAEPIAEPPAPLGAGPAPPAVEAPPAVPSAPAAAPLPPAPSPPRRDVPVLHQAVEAPAPDIALPLPDQVEARLLQQVRELLTEALRLDAPLFSARTFMRVRNAQSTGELIELVWEIEDHLSHKRRSRRELQSLQRARELLGLGNTLVGGDSTRPGYLEE
jgi:hypothetical protein